MSLSQTNTTTQLDTRRRRPGMQEFDSLQDLLEQAGYKETRIFTPIAIRSIPTPEIDSLGATVHSQQRTTLQEITAAKEKASSSSWFSTLWRPADKKNSGNRANNTLSRKQSEPVLSKKGRKAVQKSWVGLRYEHSTHPGETGAVASTSTANPVLPHMSTSDTFVEVEQQRPPLRHAPSTEHLWQGSMKYHRSRLQPSRSFPARPSDSTQGKTLARKESFDGVGVVAGVGVRAAKSVAAEMLLKGREKQRITLRQAFGKDIDKAGESSNTKSLYIDPSRQEWKDSVNSLVDLQDRRMNRAETDEQVQQSSILTMPMTASLFASAATPVLSRQDAVAMRNVDCLDYAGQQNDDPKAPRPARSLRKMRSVDALELALARMEAQQRPSGKGNFHIQATIPESFSADSLTNEDLGNATTVTTLLTDVHTFAEQQQRIPRSTTPRLVITSPTGLRSPQPLVLEGQEYEPRSISREEVRLARPVANRQSGWKWSAVISRSEKQREQSGASADEAAAPTEIPRRSSSKKRSKVVKSRGDTTAMPQGKMAKKRLSKSCNDLRGNAALYKFDSDEQHSIPSISNLSGSEQIRALQRHVLERASSPDPRRPHQQSVLVNSSTVKSVAIPCSPLDNDDDDPFRDFAAIAKAVSPSKHSNKAAPQIDRTGMSPIPFHHSKRNPLSPLKRSDINTIITTQTTTTTSTQPNQLKKGPTLHRKKSGVGIACLVEEVKTRPLPPCSSSSSLQSDENTAPNPLLDSPTAHVVKKRTSRSRLGQR